MTHAGDSGDAQRALERWRTGLESAEREVPRFDPCDGGADARLLVLLESFGPRAPRPFTVSRDNPGGTARNLARFLAEAGIARRDTILWNTVPWVIHAEGAPNRAPRRGEIAEGIELLPPFLALLPRLEIVVLAGRIAGYAHDTLAATRPALRVLAMPHPSPTFVCTSPAVPACIRTTLAEAAALLD